jgi:rfaE bifunctional protein nucleotidyltransferase chain/domain
MHPREKVVGSLVKLAQMCETMKGLGRTVVLTSGCFDLLHGGHLEYLCAAGGYGHLVVGVNSDRFVKRLKGNSRPIRPEADRAFMIAGFFMVGNVIVHDDDHDLIVAVKPDVYIASTTATVRVNDDTARFLLLQGLGVRIVEFGAMKENESTTAIIRRTKLKGR